MNVRNLAFVCGLACWACSGSDILPPDQEPNHVRYTLDGVEIAVEEGLSIAVLDETKHLLGPNTSLFIEAGERSKMRGRIIGDRIRINIPAGLSEGVYPVRYKPLPGKAAVWVSYRESVERTWAASEGVVTIEELGGVGGRLRASFDELRMINGCGESRWLTGGSVDVRIGSEDTFPESDIEYGPDSEWESLDATTMLENNLVIELDEQHFACEAVDYVRRDLPANESPTGKAESVLELIAPCVCVLDTLQGARRSSFALVGWLPLAGDGLVETEGDQYHFVLLNDVARTPLAPADDEWWFPLNDPKLRYRDITGELGSKVDMELEETLTLAFVDRSGPQPVFDESRTKQLARAHAYGFVNSLP